MTDQSVAEASRRLRTDRAIMGRLPRLLALATSATIFSAWIGWLAGAAWFLGVLLYEHFVVRHLRRHWIKPIEKTDRKKASRRYALVIFGGAVLYVWGWAYSWYVGGSAAFFLAGVWFAGTLLQGLFYFSSDRLNFVACCLPATLVVMVMPFLLTEGWIALVLMLVAAQCAGVVWRGAVDRNALIKLAVESRAARDAAERANDAKSQFLSTMTHELRTPINAVLGYAELIRDDARETGRPTVADDAQRIELAARHLLGLVNEVLDLAKLDAGHMAIAQEPMDVAVVLRDAAGLLQPLADKNGNTLTVELGELPPLVVGDPGRLRQCVLNLAGNACKFTQNGAINLTAQMEREGKHPILRIDVADTGPGIAPDMIDRLFQPFVQADASSARRHDGAGLGLVITKRLAELMGGSVSVSSKLGVGSTFTLRLRAPHASRADRAALAA